MTFARTALVAAAVVATTVAADGVTTSVLCAQDCTNCTDVTVEFTSGTTACVAGGSAASKASSTECIAAANTCVGLTNYDGDTCATATYYSEAVCGKCSKISSTSSSKLTCASGSTDISYVVYSEKSDCTGTEASISLSASCAAPLGTYRKVAKAAYGCDMAAAHTHETNE